MGARQAVFEEFLGHKYAHHCSAEQVRLAIAEAIKQADTEGQSLGEQYFALLSRFNDNHSRILYQGRSAEPLLEFCEHKLFKEITYDKVSVRAWAQGRGLELTL
ncbi:hypothetical protein [Pseudoalteromonas sp. BDTF-M6]|uniref:hypothetical protein n=1 Tax=Pseudoalteromonas sp. BDTF-M6 TaxID=2796132 RepID=UPI001BAF9A14|nr:hypothetical protein [Pseudoalteromonas sp. BDTF-M6]MBS3797152.1 hypothetical protein [Pseudoalteromonas sp. BDTF-M6]